MFIRNDKRVINDMFYLIMVMASNENILKWLLCHFS